MLVQVALNKKLNIIMIAFNWLPLIFFSKFQKLTKQVQKIGLLTFTIDKKLIMRQFWKDMELKKKLTIQNSMNFLIRFNEV